MAHQKAGLCYRALLRVVIASMIAAASAVPGHVYADMNWDGDNASGNFSFDNNWFNNTQPAWNFGNGNLNFAFSNNTSQTSLFFDYSNWRTTNDIFWLSTYGKSMELSSNGTGLDFTIRVENQSNFAQTVNMPLSGGKNGVDRMELNPRDADLTLSGPIYNDNSVDYQVWGSFGALTTLTLNSNLGVGSTAANVDFIQQSSRNTLVNVAVSQAWAGTTTVNSGSFVTGSGVTLASPTIVVGGGTVASTSANTFADSATVTVNSGRFSIGGSDTVASLAGSGGTVNVASGATLTTGNSGTTSYAGAITGGGNLTKVGSGTFTLTSASTLTGTTTVSAGRLATGAALASSNVNVSGGVFETSAADILGSSAVVTLSSGGTYSLGGSDTIGAVSGTGGTLAIGANTLTVASNSHVEFDGAITGSGTLRKQGSDRLNIKGNASAFAGSILVQTGTLIVTGTLGGLVTVESGAAIGGDGRLASNLVFAAGSKIQFDNASILDVAGTASFADPSTFGIDDVTGIDWSTITDGTYTLIAGTVSNASSLANFGPTNAYTNTGGSGKQAYFQSGSLQMVIVPEPSALAMAAAGMAVAVVARQAFARRASGKSSSATLRFRRSWPRVTRDVG